jgi:glycosyltransferase involved in cell wall biosynthesis
VTAVIAKELAKTCDVTIITFDEPSAQDITIYGLGEANINYRFFHYPKVSYCKQKTLKVYSLLYKKVLPQTHSFSHLYTYSSFPSELQQALAAELQQGHYDTIVGVHAPLAVRLAACRKRLKGVRLVGWIHNSHEALFGKGSTYIGPELRRYYEYMLRQLDQTIVLSKDDARKYPFPTRVIYNPLTLQPGKPSTGTSKKFLAVGRFSYRHKGFDLLIDAFHLFAQQNEDWTLDIVGEGPEEALYRQKIADYHLEDRIHLHPFTNHIQNYYSQAQVYVLSSRWEGFGLVLVEAMAHGLPVVSSNLPTSQEIMGDFALYFKNGHVEELAQRLYESTTLDWQAKSAEALTIARQYDISRIISQWESILF